METLNDILTGILLLILAGASLRGVQCCAAMIHDKEQFPVYKSRLVNLLQFVAISECSLSLLKIVLSYYTDGGWLNRLLGLFGG